MATAAAPCPRCRTENLPDSLFCTECGARLEKACATCGAGNPPAARFCRRCGSSFAGERPAPEPAAYTPRHLAEKILTVRAALEGERKQVTVLFADVQGSMDLAARVDPEDWHGILDGFFGILAEGVHRYEGTINQFTGDGIMALFGAPIAHEDHAQRACWAALHLRDRLRTWAEELKRTRGMPFPVRMGLNSGEVVVGRIGDDLRMDYTAQGHTVGLAARMEQLADPGHVYLTADTAQLVAGYFQLRDLGVFTVKGGGEPLHVFDLEGAGPLRTRLEVSRARGLSRFVAREREIAFLETALDRTIAGDGQVVGIVAEPGVGKSRLCLEFLDRSRARGLEVIEGHAVAHGRLIPYLPVLQLLRGFFGIQPGDDPSVTRQKIAGRLLLVDESLRDALPLAFDFMGVPDAELPPPSDPETRARDVIMLLKRMVRARRPQHPGVILAEDLHWMDPASDEILGELVEALAGTATLLLATFRPEYRADWMARPHYQQLPLQPLAAEGIDQLLRALLGSDASLDAVVTQIRDRAAGNPFFAEEIVQSLVEDGVLAGTRGGYRLARADAVIELPATVHAVLAARIDRLPEPVKHVLQTAAVLGRRVPRAVLQRVAGCTEEELAQAIATLVDADLLTEPTLHPDVEYAFKHPLTQEVAYRTQLAERRRRLHADAAEAIRELNADRLDETAALLGHHWEAAEQPIEAARWYRRAAEWIGTRNFPQALRYWRKVRELAAQAPDVPEAVDIRLDAGREILKLTARLGTSSEERSELLEELETFSQRSGDPRRRAQTALARGGVQVMAGEIDAALPLLRDAIREADVLADPGLQLASRAMLVMAEFFTGRLREALAITDEAFERLPADPSLGADIFNLSPYVLLLMLRGLLLREVGDTKGSEAALEEAAALARAHGQKELLSAIHQGFVDLARVTGDASTAFAHAEEAITVAEEIGSAFAREQAYSTLGMAHVLAGQWAEACEAFERSLAVIHDTGAGLTDAAFKLVGLAQSQLGRGDVAAAHATVLQALDRAAARQARLAALWGQVTLARIAITEGSAHWDEAARALDGAERLVEETGARGSVPAILLERAALAHARGDGAASARLLREAHVGFLAIGATTHAAEVAARLASVSPSAATPGASPGR